MGKLKENKVFRIAGIAVIAFLVFFIGAGIGSSGAEITVKDKAMDVTKLDKEIASLEEKKKSLADEVEVVNGEIESLQKEKDETVALIDTKSDVEAELKDVEAKLNDTKGVLDAELAEGRKEIESKLNEAKKELTEAEGKVTALNADVQAKQAELEKLTNGIIKKKEEPIQLNAGQYIVGIDVPAGRYQATNVGRGTNFFVYGTDGRSTVNTILGDSAVGSGDYVFFAEDGYVIETRGQVKLIPVQ